MNIQYGRQIDIKDIKGEKIDLFLLGGNHEKRVSTLYEHIKDTVTISKAIIFCFKEDFKLMPSVFEHKIIRDCVEIYEILEQVLKSHKQESFTLLVDYSCMTKPWYYSIILFLSKKNISQSNVRIIFSYTPSKYSVPLAPKPNTEITPLPGKYVVPTDKPKALIVCLGYESNKAEGIIEHLDPRLCYIFYTKPALDPSFVAMVEENNKSIIKEREKQVITYSFSDLRGLERSLNSLYQTLKNDYSIIIAPLGPKPFALISMIMAAKYNEIDIWRVSSGNNINIYEREPLNDSNFIVNDVFFSNDNFLLR